MTWVSKLGLRFGLELKNKIRTMGKVRVFCRLKLGLMLDKNRVKVMVKVRVD